MRTIFADGIANISLIDSVVRFDLVNITQIEKEKTNLSSVGTVAMSITALVRIYSQISRTIDKMVADGVLKKNEAPRAIDGLDS
jgi:hypothetical protein